jgi:redox-sensitive bicupin YhaK (pirin superfamily)
MVINMKKKVFLGFAIIACFAVIMGFSGCGDKEKETSSRQTDSTLGTAPPILEFDISSLVTPEQVGNALGVKVGEGQSADQDTTVRYYSEDQSSFLEISIMEGSREEFDEIVASYEGAVDTMNLGQAAKWNSETKQLFVFDDGYMISVIAYADKSDDSLLVAARQIAALVLEKI